MSVVEFLSSSFTGITFLLIGVSILGVIIYGPYLSVQLYRFRKKGIKKTNIDAMLILGIVVFISGILYQIAGMIEALEAMIEMADISPGFVMEGIIESFKLPVLCAFVLIVSLLFWFFNKKKWESLNS